MNPLLELLPFLIPVLIIDIILAVVAVHHILHHSNYRFGNKTIWLVIVLVMLLFGPIIYFIFGKGEEE